MYTVHTKQIKFILIARLILIYFYFEYISLKFLQIIDYRLNAEKKKSHEWLKSDKQKIVYIPSPSVSLSVSFGWAPDNILKLWQIIW